MAKVRLLGGKPLMVAGKVALSDNCCCQPADCCDRDVTEINTLTLVGSFSMTGADTASCTFTTIWTRIPNANSFDGSNQFKLYFGALPTCQLFAIFSDAFGLELPQSDCSGAGAFDTIFGSIRIEQFLVNMGTGNVTLQFTVNSSESAAGNSCAVDSGNILLPFTSCDVSGLAGTHTITNHCVDAFFTFDISGSVIIA